MDVFPDKSRTQPVENHLVHYPSITGNVQVISPSPAFADAGEFHLKKICRTRGNTKKVFVFGRAFRNYRHGSHLLKHFHAFPPA
jgi:hypothetical protein